MTPEDEQLAKEASKLFSGRVAFLLSAPQLKHLPDPDYPEIAFCGRSNVGKSSLINALVQRKAIARTSVTPGRTQELNFFEVGDPTQFRLVDMPGYGFAKVSKAEQQKWATMLSEYIEERENLVSVILLIDGAVGPTSLDLQTVEWLHSLDRPITYVATKADKVKPSKSKKRRTELTEKLGVAKADVTWVSAEKGTGIPELRQTIRTLLGAS